MYAIKSQVMRARRAASLAYRASTLMATGIVRLAAPCCHLAGEIRARQQDFIASIREDSLMAAGRSSSSCLTLRMSHCSWPPSHEPKSTESFHTRTRTSEKIQPHLLLERINKASTMDELLTIVEKNASNLDARAVDESLLRSSKFKQEKGRSLSRSVWDRLQKAVVLLERRMTDRISDYSAYYLASCAHKLAKMRLGKKSTFQAIEKEAIIKLQDFQPRSLANLLWAFEKAKVEARQLFQAVDAHLQSHPGLLKKFNAQDIANIVLAYAKAGEKASKLFAAVDAHLHRHPGLLKKFNAQDIANSVWSYATAKEKAPKLFEAVDALLQSHPGLLKKFNAQNIANLALAYAKAGEKAPRLFEAVDALLHTNPKRLEAFNAQDIANTLWSFATAGEKAPKLFEAVDALLHTQLWRLKEFNPQNIANTLWSFATAGETAPKLFDEAVDALLLSNPERLNEFDPQEISNVLWSYAEQRHDAPGLFDLISKQVVKRLDEYSPQELSMTVRAYAVLYHPGAEGIIQAALQRAVNDPNAFDPQHLANIMHAAVVFEKLDAATLKFLASAMASMELQEEGYHSVFQSCLGLQLYSSPDSTPASLLPGRMHDIAKSLWLKKAKDFQQSALHKDVVKVLRQQMGLKCHPEWMTPDGLFSIDIMVELPASNKEGASERVAVEVDGPSHFTSTRPYKTLGRTRLRRRLLEARVDRVVSVPFYEWDAAESASAKKKLLERLIIA